MKAKAIICGGLMVGAIFLGISFNASAEENKIGGNVDYKTDVTVSKVKAEGGTLGIGAFNMQNGSSIGGDVKMAGVGVKVQAADVTANGQEMQIGGFNIDGSEVGGDVTLNQDINIQSVEAYKGSGNTLIGGMQMRDGSSVQGDVTLTTDVDVAGKIQNHGDLNLAAVRMSGAQINGDATFDLTANIQGEINVHDEGSAVYVAGANFANSQVGSVNIVADATTGSINASNGATVRVADTNISGVNMGSSSLDLNLKANVGDIEANGANVEIASFNINN